MLSLNHSLPAIARRRRGAGFPPPQPVVFPAHAFGYWEGQGQSNMTGFNQVGDAPANLRVVNPNIEMMTNDPGWRPYILLDNGESETVDGAVYDGTGTALKDAMVEVWQADADGVYPGGRDPRGLGDPNFSGWGRKAGDPVTGEWTFETIRPGAVPFPDGRMQAPHITFWVVARGINVGLQTRMYFPEDDTAADPILTRIEHQNRVPTLIAGKTGEGQYRFDIRLQGEGETIFFDM